MRSGAASGRPGDDVSRLEIDSTPSSIGLVRRFCVDACATLGWADRADTVELLVSELATNAVVHAYGARVRVQVRVRGRRLRVEVSDDSLSLPAPRLAAVGAENGRGLALVDALAVDAGCDVRAGGKTTWFEVGD